MNKNIAILVTALALSALVLSFHAGRNSKSCPQVVNLGDSLMYYRDRIDSLSVRLSYALLQAKEEHIIHVREINTRPTPKFDEYFTRSANADSARAKWHGILLQRPRQYRYRTDSAGHVLPADSLR